MDSDPREQRASGQDISGSCDELTQVKYSGVSVEKIGRIWGHAMPLLVPALGEGELIETVIHRLFVGTAQLWIAADADKMHAACVTEIVNRGVRKYCNIWLAGGAGLNNWLSYLPEVEEWAKANGCHAMLIEKARSGWKRILPDYKTKTIQMVKEL
jgi:hypothetical protein